MRALCARSWEAGTDPDGTVGHAPGAACQAGRPATPTAGPTAVPASARREGRLERNLFRATSSRSSLRSVSAATGRREPRTACAWIRYEGVIKGTQFGPIVMPGQPNQSAMVSVITGDGRPQDPDAPRGHAPLRAGGAEHRALDRGRGAKELIELRPDLGPAERNSLEAAPQGLVHGSVVMQKQSEERQNEQDDEKAVTRRTFLSYVNVAIGGFLTVLLGIPLIGAAVLPALRRGEENLVSAGPVSSFNVGEPKARQRDHHYQGRLGGGPGGPRGLGCQEVR